MNPILKQRIIKRKLRIEKRVAREVLASNMTVYSRSWRESRVSPISELRLRTEKETEEWRKTSYANLS